MEPIIFDFKNADFPLSKSGIDYVKKMDLDKLYKFIRNQRFGFLKIVDKKGRRTVYVLTNNSYISFSFSFLFCVEEGDILVRLDY